MRTSKKLIAERQAARKEKNFARADEIRDELLANGYRSERYKRRSTMEKSITAGLEEYIRTIPGMKEIDAKQCSPLVLAYVGDCVYDLIIKTMVVGRGNRPVHRLHEETSQYGAGISTVLYDAFSCRSI